MPCARMAICYHGAFYRDLAVLDFSTCGHGLYNYGHLSRLSSAPEIGPIYTTHLTEVDIALGDFSRLDRAVSELKEKGYKHIFLLPSSLGSVLGFDLESAATELSAKYGVEILFTEAGLDDDFYVGEERVLSAFAKRIIGGKRSIRKGSFAVIGGGFTHNARIINASVSELAEKTFGLTCVFDNLNAENLEEWENCLSAEFILTTSLSARGAVELLKSAYGVPYLYFNPLGKSAEDEMLGQIAALTGESFSVEQDKTYDYAAMQFKNIVETVQPEIVCYLSVDRLRALRGFFFEFGIKAAYFCSHKESGETFVEINDFIEKYVCGKDALIISYDAAGKYAKRFIESEYIGQDYKLLTPLKKSLIGKAGGYRLMELISERLFR